MKKKMIGMLSLMLCLLLSVSLVACNKNKHEAKSEWKYNDTQHWHECATNGHDDKLDEAEHTWSAWTVTASATCTEKGEEERTCTVCGKKETREVEMAEHTWSAWTVTASSTCTEKGEEERTCTVCDKKETREVEMAEHEYTYTYDSSTCTFVAPTEKTEGAMLLKCDNCDHKEQVFVYPVISDENYSSNCSNVNNSGWIISCTLKDAFYANHSISDEIKAMTQRSFKVDVEAYEDTLGCNLIELLEAETDDEMSFSYEFTAPGRYYIAMKDSSKTKAFSSITFTPATDEATTLSSMFVYNQSGAEMIDESNEANTFEWMAGYASNMITNSTATFLIVVDVETAGAGTFTIGLAK